LDGFRVRVLRMGVAPFAEELPASLGDDTRNLKIIVNLRGIGYKVIPPKENSLCE